MRKLVSITTLVAILATGLLFSADFVQADPEGNMQGGTYAAREELRNGSIGPEDKAGGTFAGQSSEIDTDMDGCNDAEEVAKGMNPNNFFDFPDVDRDLQIDALDMQNVSVRWGATYASGSPLYDVKFDVTNGTASGGPNGGINIYDLQYVMSRFGIRCQGVPTPNINDVCAELQQEALQEGYSLFNCGGEGAGFPAGGTEMPMKMRAAQVIPQPNKGVIVYTQDLDITGAFKPPPAGSAGGKVAGGAVAIPHPVYCDTHYCHVWYEAKAEIRHLFGYGPNCAWMKFHVEHDEFSPWAAIYNVDDPIVWGNATVPCEDDNMEWSLNLSGLPTTLRSRGEVDWKAGIPTPWGYVGVRSWHAVIDLKAYANYTYEFRMY